VTGVREDGQLIAAFLEMLAAEAGAALNTRLAYERDLRGASELLGGRLSSASPAALKRLSGAWIELKPATVARKAAALRRFYGFLHDEGLRGDDPSAALPRPASVRPLPKILGHEAVGALFAELDRMRREEPGASVLRLSALVELLYGSGMRATELVSLPRHAVHPDKPFLILSGKGGRERLVPISDRARAAVAEWAALVPRDSLWLFPSGRAISAGSGSTSCSRGSPPPPECRRSGSAPTSFATLSRPTCSKGERIFEPCRCYSAMPISPPPRSTPMSTAAGSSTWSTAAIRSLMPAGAEVTVIPAEAGTRAGKSRRVSPRSRLSPGRRFR
jgi:site-specific recombinase XerD